MTSPLATRLTELRKNLGLTQNELWRVSYPSMAEKAISQYESGMRLPSPQVLVTVLQTLARDQETFLEVAELAAQQDPRYEPATILLKRAHWQRADFERWALSFRRDD